MVAAFGLGAGWAALDRAIAYSRKRIQAGGPLSEKQGYTHKLIVPHAVAPRGGARGHRGDRRAHRRRRGRAEHRGRDREVPRHRGGRRGGRRRDPGPRRLRLHPRLHGREDQARRPHHQDLRGHLGDHGDDDRPRALAGAPEDARRLLPRRARELEALHAETRRSAPASPRSAACPGRRDGARAASAGSPATSTCCCGSASWWPRPRAPARWPAARTRRPQVHLPAKADRRLRAPTRSPRSAGSCARDGGLKVAERGRALGGRGADGGDLGRRASASERGYPARPGRAARRPRRRSPTRSTGGRPDRMTDHRWCRRRSWASARSCPTRRTRRRSGQHHRRPLQDQRRRRRIAGIRSSTTTPTRSAPDKTYSKIGGWVRDWEWEPLAWKLPIPPKVGDAMDDGQKWAVACTRMALLDAGWPERDRSTQSAPR